MTHLREREIKDAISTLEWTLDEIERLEQRIEELEGIESVLRGELNEADRTIEELESNNK